MPIRIEHSPAEPPPPMFEGSVSGTLRAAAFGQAPHLLRLPAPSSAREWWTAAVVWGGQGHYARARAALDVVDRQTAGASAVSALVLRSLAASTRASFLRQSGRHARASGWDGRALSILDDCDVSLRATEATCDALTGLAADALGCGRLSLGWRLLKQCEGSLTPGGDALWRQQIRFRWVSAELSLAGGDFVQARDHADAALELANQSNSVRHQVKSALIASAALTGSDLEAAVASAREVHDRCLRYRLLPLAWASALLVEGVSGIETTPSADELGGVIGRRGGDLLSLS